MAFKLKRSTLLPLWLFFALISGVALALFAASAKNERDFNVTPVDTNGDGINDNVIVNEFDNDLWTVTKVLFGIGVSLMMLYPLALILTTFQQVPKRFLTLFDVLWGLATLAFVGAGIGLIIAELADKDDRGEWWGLLWFAIPGWILTLVSIPLILAFSRRKTRGVEKYPAATPGITEMRPAGMATTTTTTTTAAHPITA